jgi:two-component system, cell cycle sensor histidine kinase and response regulator CckA
MEAVGQLAAGVAHDFNNLLTIIHGHTSIRLRSDNLDRKVADSLAAVQQASERAADLTRQLLAFSRKQVLEKGTLCLAAAITNVSAMLMRLIPENIHLHFEHAASRPSIYGDRCNIEQVLLNLVVNARDAMPRGGDIFVATELVEITAAHARRNTDARAGQFVCLQVRDTGVGMEETVLRQIFVPFFTTKQAGKGTGMGLATVHGIVKQHDGWIEVTSSTGAGSTFRVYFPLSAPAVETAPATWRSLPTQSIANFTVLLVEDDGDVRALARHVLEESELRVIEAPDGPTALLLWEKHRNEIDLLLTDMVMPGGLTGADLADRILAERPTLPVVYSSGYSVALFSEDRNFRKDVNYLPKPYLSRDLVAIITTALAKRTETTPAPALQTEAA